MTVRQENCGSTTGASASSGRGSFSSTRVIPTQCNGTGGVTANRENCNLVVGFLFVQSSDKVLDRRHRTDDLSDTQQQQLITASPCGIAPSSSAYARAAAPASPMSVSPNCRTASPQPEEKNLGESSASAMAMQPASPIGLEPRLNRRSTFAQGALHASLLSLSRLSFSLSFCDDAICGP